jgi:hypothetical protein
MMELDLGVSVVLLKGYFGGAVLWFVADARVVDVWAGRHHSSAMRAGTVRVTRNADGPEQWSLCVSLPLPFALFAILSVGVTIPSSSHHLSVFSRPWEKKALDVLCPSRLGHGVLVPLLVHLCLPCISSPVYVTYILAWCEM